jgi:hypothetical protein
MVAMSYHVTAELDGRFWLVRVEAIDRATQARNVAEIPTMARELITLMTGEIDPEIDVSIVLPEQVKAHLASVARAREREDQARHERAVELRRAARELRNLHLTLTDVGAVLGVSHQRAHQLLQNGQEAA